MIASTLKRSNSSEHHRLSEEFIVCSFYHNHRRIIHIRSLVSKSFSLAQQIFFFVYFWSFIFFSFAWTFQRVFMIHLNEKIIIQTFELNQFWLAEHKFGRKILIKELLQIIQIIIITKIKSQIRSLSVKIKSRVIRVVSVESFEYLSEWVVNKTTFREACSEFWVSIEKYRTFREFFVFKSRLDSTESKLNDDSDQLSSSSQSSFLLKTLLKIFAAFKKKFHRRFISLHRQIRKRRVKTTLADAAFGINLPRPRSNFWVVSERSR